MQITTMAATATMSSREVAELADARHNDVCATIERLFSKGLLRSNRKTRIEATGGRPISVYDLNERDTYIVIAGYSDEVRARIIDRWQELEAQNKPPAPADLSRMDILKLAIESEQARIHAEAERDEAIRTKAQIGSRREATAMATASAAKAEAEKLRDKLGAGTRQASVRAVNGMTGHNYDWLPLRRWCKAHNVTPADVFDPLFGMVKAWPAAAWKECHQVDLVAMFG